MFKNTKSTKWTALLVALVLVTSLFVGGTIARYITSTSSEDTARVAVWGINEAGTTMDLFENEYTIDGSGELKAKSTDDDDIIAPGLNGASEFKIVNTSTLKPEVMYEIAISLDDSEIADEIKNHLGIEWKVDNGEWGTWEEFKTELLSLSGDPSGVKVYAPLDVNHEFANGKTHTVAWQWIMDSGYDEEDTAMGNYAATTGDITAKLSITVTARQTDVDSTGMLEGNGSVFNTNDPQPLTFRADADYSTFDSVKINGTTLNPEHYIDESGSIKITLKKSYLETLSKGKYTMTIVSTDSEFNATFSVVESTVIAHNDIIPEGGVYYVGVPTYDVYEWDDIYDIEVPNPDYDDPRDFAPQIGNYRNYTAKYESGDKFPATVNIGDIYVYGDYEYRYGMVSKSEGVNWYLNDGQNGWGVLAISKTKSSHGQPLTTINNKNLTHMEYTFGYSQTSISPIIPNTVISTATMFEGSKIVTAPIIPNSVKNTTGMFVQCYDLINPPIIPQNVLYASGMFGDCTSLEKDLEINANNLIEFSSMISGTQVTNITGTISNELKEQIFTTSGKTYVNPDFDHTGTIPEGGTYYRGVTSNRLNDYTGYTAKYGAGESFPTPALAGDVYVYDGREYRVDAYYNLYGYDPETDSQIECWEFVNYGASSWSGKIFEEPTTELLDRINGLLVDPSSIN